MTKALREQSESKATQINCDLGPFENLIWLVDQWTPRHFIFVARIEGAAILIPDLRAALLQSQRRHPILRAAIRMNRNGKPGLVPSNEPISLRVVQRANRTQWIHEVETELALPFEPDDQTLMRVVLVQGEAQ